MQRKRPTLISNTKLIFQVKKKKEEEEEKKDNIH